MNTEHGEHIKAGHDSGGGGTVIPADTDHDEEIEKFSKKVHTSRLLEQQKQQEEEEQEKQGNIGYKFWVGRRKGWLNIVPLFSSKLNIQCKLIFRNRDSIYN